VSRPVVRTLAALLLGALLPACAGSGGDSGPGEESAGTEGLAGDLVVFAAASLTDVLDALADAFVAQHPDVTVVANLAGSQTLAGQLLEGAPADVFISADEPQLARVVDAELATTSIEVASNELTIVVEPGNPAGVADVDDLARDDLVLVLADEDVPAGRYAREVLDGTGTEVTPASLELDVRAVLSKVRLGEADAGIVFVTDAIAADGAVATVPIPAEDNVVTTYPAAVLRAAPNPDVATAFLEFLGSDAARDVLVAAGFGVPA
jgi:molybdate transport system substrate-binding protein